MFVWRERYPSHEFPDLRVHILLPGEGIEVNMPIQEHASDVVGRAVVGGLTVAGIPFRRIANLLPAEIMELRVDRFDLFGLGPGKNLRSDILVKILIVAFGGDAFIASAVSMYRLDGQPSIGTGRKLQIARERTNVGGQAVPAFERHAGTGHPLARQHGGPYAVTDLLRTMGALPH